LKISITIIVLFVSSFSFAQMRVEDIKTEKDVIRFLDLFYFKENKKDTIATIKKTIDTLNYYYVDSFVQKYVDSAGYPKWIIKDFNEDKQKDLIFCGFFNGDSRVISFVSDRFGGYRYSILSFQYEMSAPHFIYLVSNEEYFAIARCYDDFPNWDSTCQFKSKFRIDTVQYVQEIQSFIDYNYLKKPKNKIDTVRYQFISFKKFGNDKILISSDGYARKIRIFPIGDSANRVGRHYYEKRLSEDSLKRMFDFVNRLPLIEYDDEYTPVTTGWMDGFTILTEFSNRKGFYKRIADHLQTAPLGIQFLYSLLFEVRKSTDWKLINIEYVQ